MGRGNEDEMCIRSEGPSQPLFRMTGFDGGRTGKDD